MLVGSVATFELNISPFGASSSGDNLKPALLAIGGVGAIIGSIVSFSAAKQHKKKAAELTFGNQRVPVVRQSGFVSYMQPALQLRIRLGNHESAVRRQVR